MSLLLHQCWELKIRDVIDEETEAERDREMLLGPCISLSNRTEALVNKLQVLLRGVGVLGGLKQVRDIN